MRRVLNVHMCREHVGEAADLTAPHGVRLPRYGERSHAGLADAARRQVAVDDGVDLVGAGRRLVDALAVDGDRLLRLGEQREELLEHFGGNARHPHQRIEVEGVGGAERVLEAGRVLLDVATLGGACACQIAQQPEEQRHVAVRLDG